MGLEKDSLSSESSVLFCAVVNPSKAAQAVLPCGVVGLRALGVLSFSGKVGLQVQEADGLEIMLLGILFLKMHWKPASEPE